MLVYIIFAIFVIIVIGVSVFIKFKPNHSIVEDPFAGNQKNLRIKGPFMDKEEFYYYDIMNRHLPNDFVIVPKIGMDNLLTSIGNKSQYEAISSKYVDFIIFDKKTLLPIVAIDLVEDKMSSNLTYFDKDVKKALEMVGIPIYTQKVEDFYVFDDLFEQMKTKIPALNDKNDKKEVEGNSEAVDAKKE